MVNASSPGQFKIYPRGFLGARLEMRLETSAELREDSRGLSEVRQKQLVNSNDFQAVNINVETLYAQYIKRVSNSGSFEFRKSLLIVALSAFGTRRFDDWYAAQLKSPFCGDLHQRFLEDTLRFIQEGRRELSLETWNSLITAEDTGDHSGRLTEYANEFFGIPSDGYNRYSQRCDLLEVIQLWCSQPNGLEDLLGTLHVLFGKL